MNINGIYILSILKILGILILLASLLFLKQKHKIKDNYENSIKNDIKRNNMFENDNLIYEKNEHDKWKSADILTGSNELYPINGLDIDYGNKIENNIYCDRFIESP